MRRIERARKIRDQVLKQAALSLEASLKLGERPWTICNGAWEARIGRVRTESASMPVIGAARIDLWVHGERVAAIAWTADKLWVPHMRRGHWESEHFNQPPYRSSAERWIDVCNLAPVDQSVFALIRQSRPVQGTGRTPELIGAN